MNTNIFAQLKSEYPFLSRVEKSIADEILRAPGEFITCSMTELAEKAGVSQGSINNFAKKFSLGGFSALKLKVAASLTAHEEEPFEVIDSAKGVKAAMELKIKEDMAAFHNTLELNDEATLKGTVDRILAAKKIEVYGIFHSGIAARDFCYQLIQLGIPATFVSDTLMCAVSASMLDKDCLVVAVSSSGRTKEIIDAVEIAREGGAPVIALTCDRFSPLAALADEVLLTASSGISVSDKRDEIRLAQLLILDTLCSYIRSTIDAGDRAHYDRLAKITNSHSIED